MKPKGPRRGRAPTPLGKPRRRPRAPTCGRGASRSQPPSPLSPPSPPCGATPPARGPALREPPGGGGPGGARTPLRRPRLAPTHRWALRAAPRAVRSSCAAPRARLHLPLWLPPSLRGPAGGERGAVAKPGAGAGAGGRRAAGGAGGAPARAAPRAPGAPETTPQVAAPRAPEAREVAGGAKTRRQPGSGREREGRYLLGEGGPSSFRTPSLPPVWPLAALGGPPCPGPTHSPKLCRRRWGELIPESPSTRPWGVRTPARERAWTRRARWSESGEPRAPPLQGVRSAGTPDDRWGAAEGSGGGSGKPEREC